MWYISGFVYVIEFRKFSILFGIPATIASAVKVLKGLTRFHVISEYSNNFCAEGYVNVDIFDVIMIHIPSHAGNACRLARTWRFVHWLHSRRFKLNFNNELESLDQWRWINGFPVRHFWVLQKNEIVKVIRAEWHRAVHKNEELKNLIWIMTK